MQEVVGLQECSHHSLSLVHPRRRGNRSGSSAVAAGQRRDCLTHVVGKRMTAQCRRDRLFTMSCQGLFWGASELSAQTFVNLQVFRVWFNDTDINKYQIYHLYEMYNVATYTYHPNLLARIKCGQTKHVGASPLPKRRYRSQKKPQKNNKVCFIYRKKGKKQNWTPPNRILYILLPWVGLFFGTSPHKKQPNQLPSCTAILRLAIHLIHRTSSTWPSWITQLLPIWKTSLSRGTVDVMWSTQFLFKGGSCWGFTMFNQFPLEETTMWNKAKKSQNFVKTLTPLTASEKTGSL